MLQSQQVAEAPLTALQELRSRWLILLASFVGIGVGVVSLPIYPLGVIMGALHADFGWSRGVLSLAPSVTGMAVAITGIFYGSAMDRWPIDRYVIPISHLCVAGGLTLLSLMPNAPGVYLAIYASLGVAGVATSTVGYSRVIALNFSAARGTALAGMMLGVSSAAIFTPLFATWAIAHYGWRGAYAGFAMVAGGVGLPASAILWFATAPRRAPPVISGASLSARAIMRTRVFWTMAFGFMAAVLAVQGMSLHIVPLLRDHNFGAAEAAGYASLLGVAMTLARLLSGLLLDRVHGPWIAAGISALAAFGMLAMWLQIPFWPVIGALAVGAAWGAEHDVAAYLTSRYYGTQSFGRAFGLSYFFFVAGSLISFSAYGFIFDWQGNYDPALIGALIALTLSVIAFLTLPPYPKLEAER